MKGAVSKRNLQGLGSNRRTGDCYSSNTCTKDSTRLAVNDVVHINMLSAQAQAERVACHRSSYPRTHHVAIFCSAQNKTVRSGVDVAKAQVTMREKVGRV